MLYKFINCGLVFTILGLVSCQNIWDETSLGMFESDDVVQSKILHTKSGAAEDVLLVKFDAVPTSEFLQQLISDKVVSFEKLFNSVPGKEEMEKRFGLDRWYVVNLAGHADVDQEARTLAQNTKVSLVEYDIRMNMATDGITYPYEGPTLSTKASMNELGFNDPLLVRQWNYYNIGDKSIATSAYAGADINIKDTWLQLTAGDPSIVVAVVDQGVAYTHPDLASNMWVNTAEYSGQAGVDDDNNGYVDDIYGYNFVDRTGRINYEDTEHDTGHGTHCAGIIGAVNNNGTGMSGVAGGTGNNDGVRIMSCQVFSGDKGGEARHTATAIKYAADNGASIISCSYGYRGGLFTTDGAFLKAAGSEADAIRYFEATKNNPVIDGGVAVYASGNEALPYAGYPGAMNDVICVSAFAPDFLPTNYTNYGPGCNIVAPGGEALLPPWTSYDALILSTVPLRVDKSGYGYKQGTSMACPHVSGIAALGLSYAKKIGKTFSTREFKELLVSSANDFDSRLNGTKSYYNNYAQPLNLGDFMKKMGTGSVDTWIFMMKIEGVPSLTAEMGKESWVDVSEYFGTSSKNLTYLSVTVDEATKTSLGLKSAPYMKYGRLYIHPTKMGSGKVTIKAVGGGEVVGGEDAIGGMEITQEVGIISRPFKSSNGGWL